MKRLRRLRSDGRREMTHFSFETPLKAHMISIHSQLVKESPVKWNICFSRSSLFLFFFFFLLIIIKEDVSFIIQSGSKHLPMCFATKYVAK